MDVKIYTTPTCGYCQQAKAFFRQKGVAYREIDVSQNQTAAQEMVNLTGQMGVPVIVIDGEVIVGFDMNRIVELLSNAKSTPPKVRFGLRIADAQKMMLPPGGVAVAGAYIGDVTPGFLGEKAGLKTGDIITRVNDRPVNGAGDLEQILVAVKSGDIVAFMFQRAGQSSKSEIVA